jgi:hypothetical protein
MSVSSKSIGRRSKAVTAAGTRKFGAVPLLVDIESLADELAAMIERELFSVADLAARVAHRSGMTIRACNRRPPRRSSARRGSPIGMHNPWRAACAEYKAMGSSHSVTWRDAVTR